MPAYDRRQARVGVVHIGVGGFHRAHQAMYHDRLMNAGDGLDWGICGVGVMGPDRLMRDALEAQDGLYTLIVKHPDGTYQPRVIGSVLEYLFAPDDPDAVLGRLAEPSVRIVSLTVTEGAYDIRVAGSDAVPMAFALIIEALRLRRERGIEPFTVMSCDNLQGNGDAARTAVTTFAQLIDAELAAWIGRAVAFPNAMVDRITPQTTDADREELRRRFGVEDRWPVVCEPYAQWVLEDHFTTGRPPYEDAGVTVVGDVGPYERMKVRLLNGGHQALGYFGYLAGRRIVHEAALDPLLRRFVRDYMDHEVTPTLAPLPGVDADAYKDTLLERFSNPEVRDTVARLCAQSSDRIPEFVLPVVREQLRAGGPIERGAAIVASWARYARGIDEAGEPIEVVDALREELMDAARHQDEDPDAFIANRQVFGDLADDERFAEAYRTALRSLLARGARGTLEALTGRG